MKKVTTITTVAILAILVVSCSKTSSGLASQSTSSSQSQPTFAPVEKTIVSPWVFPSAFTAEADRFGKQIIVGNYPFTAATQISYDENTHVELAYIRIPTGQRIPYKYMRLATDLSVDINGIISTVTLDYSLDPDGFKVYFKNAVPPFLSAVVNQASAGDWRFMYIVIPKTRYQSAHINWNDLTAVAATLNISL